jgi:hypothetical protein
MPKKHSRETHLKRTLGLTTETLRVLAAKSLRDVGGGADAGGVTQSNCPQFDTMRDCPSRFSTCCGSGCPTGHSCTH